MLLKFHLYTHFLTFGAKTFWGSLGPKRKAEEGEEEEGTNKGLRALATKRARFCSTVG